MNNTQAQLLNIALNERDIVYTPNDIARDVVAFFKPSGKILEPCSGNGAFMRYLPPDTEWCEIERGRDFFAEHRHFDWIVGNPPYGDIEKWILHGLELSPNVVYLFRFNTIFQSYHRMKRILDAGGIKVLYVVGMAHQMGWAGGAPVGAVHFQRGYTGGMAIRFRDAAPPSP